MFKNLKAALAQLLAVILDEGIVDFLPIVATTASQIGAAFAANNKLAVIAAATNFQVQVLAKFPTLTGQLAGILASYVNAETTSAVAAANADLTNKAGLLAVGASV